MYQIRRILEKLFLAFAQIEMKKLEMYIYVYDKKVQYTPEQ